MDRVFATTLELDYLSHYIFRVWERTDSDYEELDPRRFRVEVSFSDGATVDLNDFHRARNVKRKSRNSATSSELLQHMAKAGQAVNEDTGSAKAEEIAEAGEEAGDTDDESDDETAASLRSDTDARASAKPKPKKNVGEGEGAGGAAGGGAAAAGRSRDGPLPAAGAVGSSAKAENTWIMSPITQRTSFTLPLTAVKAALLVPAERWLWKKQEKQREKQRKKDEEKEGKKKDKVAGSAAAVDKS